MADRRDNPRQRSGTGRRRSRGIHTTGAESTGCAEDIDASNDWGKGRRT